MSEVNDPLFVVKIGDQGELQVTYARQPAPPQTCCGNLENQPMSLGGYTELVGYETLSVLIFKNPSTAQTRLCIKLKNCDYYCSP